MHRRLKETDCLDGQLGNGLFCRTVGLQVLIDPRRHLASFDDGPDDQRADFPIASHSSLVMNRLGFKAPVA